MSSATFFSGVFGGAGGEGRGFSIIYLIFFFIISGIWVYFDTFSYYSFLFGKRADTTHK